MSLMSEFKDFVAKGNVLDLAVGVIIGAAFGKIVTAFTDDLIMPLVGLVFGGTDFSSKYIVLSGDVKPGTPLAAAQAAGANVLAYGDFISVCFDFLIMAFVIFMVVRAANKAMKKPDEAAAGPSEVELLTQIRDSLKSKK